MKCRNVWRASVAKFAVNLVGKEVEIVFFYQIANLVHLLARVEVARRIIGIADENAFGFGRYQFFELRHRRQRKTLLDGRNNGFHHGTRSNGKRRVVGVGRLWHNDFVAGVEATHKRKLHRLRAASRYDDIIDADIDIEAAVVVQHLHAQTFEAVAGAVF